MFWYSKHSTEIYNNFPKFFSIFLFKFCQFLSFSALRAEKFPPEFHNRVLNNFWCLWSGFQLFKIANFDSSLMNFSIFLKISWKLLSFSIFSKKPFSGSDSTKPLSFQWQLNRLQHIIITNFSNF